MKGSPLRQRQPRARAQESKRYAHQGERPPGARPGVLKADLGGHTAGALGPTEPRAPGLPPRVSSVSPAGLRRPHDGGALALEVERAGRRRGLTHDPAESEERARRVGTLRAASLWRSRPRAPGWPQPSLPAPALVGGLQLRRSPRRARGPRAPRRGVTARSYGRRPGSRTSARDGEVTTDPRAPRRG